MFCACRTVRCVRKQFAGRIKVDCNKQIRHSGRRFDFMKELQCLYD